MIISQTLEYALRAVVFIANGQERSYTTAQIAKTTKVPQAYLSKVLQSLVRGNIIQSQRGFGGGFILAKNANEIKILDIVAAVDPMERIHTCPLELATHGSNLCSLHKRLDDAIATMQTTFSGTSITQIVSQENAILPMFECPKLEDVS